MKVLKPEWMHHDDASIFSIDAHPSQPKVATAGQSKGGGGGLVVIWNLAAVRGDVAASRSLSRLEHTRCVNCVRWSRSGALLACAGDEGVGVWQMVGRVRTAGSIGEEQRAASVEQWRCLHRLLHHDGDVLHVDWSPSDRCLASCSVDNKVVIWNAAKLPEKVAVLTGHGSMVKGLSWDPIGRYLATQSSDKTVKVWSTSTWELVTSIEKPFAESCDTAMMLRLDWSPDGTLLLAPNAMNSGAPTAVLVERNKDWAAVKDLVGHRKAVAATRWSRSLFERRRRDGRVETAPLVAVGCRECALSVWHWPTRCRRPLVVLTDLFRRAVVDLTWSSEGLCLLACSTDGSVACVVFSAEEIGTPLSRSQMDGHLSGIYGSSAAMANGSVDIVDNPKILRQLQQKSVAPTIPEESVPQKPSATPLAATPTARVAQPGVSAKPAASNNRIPEDGVPSVQQVESRTRDGRRRIQPVMLQRIDADEGELLTQPSAAECSTSTLVVAAPLPSIGPSAASLAAAAVAQKRATPSPTKRSGAPAKRKAAAASPQHSAKRRAQPQPAVECSDARPPSPVNRVDEFSQTSQRRRLSLSRVRAEFDSLSVCAENGVAVAGGLTLTKVCATLDNAPVWTALLDSPAVSVAASKEFVCVGCDDSTLNILRSSGGQKFCLPLCTDAPAVILRCNSEFVMVVTSASSCYVWNLKHQSSVVSGRSFASLLSGGAHALADACSVDQDGVPLIGLSNGVSAVYSRSFESWQVVARANGAVERVAACRPSVGASAGVVARLLATAAPRNDVAAPTSGAQMRPAAITAALEARLEAAVALNSPRELKAFLVDYVSQLIKAADLNRLRQVCQRLLGRGRRSLSSAQSPSVGTVAGVPQRALLELVLPQLAENALTQPLFAEFRDALDGADTGGIF